jgi:hypothetical protein
MRGSGGSAASRPRSVNSPGEDPYQVPPFFKSSRLLRTTSK